MNRPLSHFALFLFLCGSLVPLPGQEPAESPAAPETPHSRLVKYAEHDAVPVNAKIRPTTLIILPEDERILDFTCGDKDYWIVDGNENFAFVTAAGNVYSFVLTQVSDSSSEPDLKVFIEPSDYSMLLAETDEPRFVPSSQIEAYRQQIELAKTEARQAKEQAQEIVEQQIGEFRSNYPASLHFGSKFHRGRKPLSVDAIHHDGRLPCIQASPQEALALYERRHGKPNPVTFDYRDGDLIIPPKMAQAAQPLARQAMLHAEQLSAQVSPPRYAQLQTNKFRYRYPTIQDNGLSQPAKSSEHNSLLSMQERNPRECSPGANQCSAPSRPSACSTMCGGRIQRGIS